MSQNALVFAGTTEGRNICEYLAAHGVEVTASVATEYGRVLMPEHKRIHVHTGRLDAEAVKEFISGFSLVIDATHPYAEEVTRNVKEACKAAKIDYLRLIRPSSEYGGAVIVADAKAAAEYLRETTGNVLITAGSKELSAFTCMDGYQERCYARVLPSAEAIEACRGIGLKSKNIICMQGPFSHQMNLALIKEIRAKYLVTKDSGAVGGFAEKLSAAKEAGITVVLIARPTDEAGVDFGRMTEILNLRFVIQPERDGYFPFLSKVADR